MGVRVKVRDIVREMDVLGPGITLYLNRKTGELIALSEDEVSELETDDPEDVPEWVQDMLPKLREVTESQDYLPLPDSYDIHEWQIMQDFADSISDADASDELLRALHGRGAFRYFRDLVHRLGLRDDWYRFRDEKFEGIAIDWLEANGVPYTRERGDE